MQPKLLVVDDERPLAESIADYFDARGYLVDVASELEEAEALISGTAYDVVITDLRLTPTAHEEGLELLSFVHQRWPGTLTLVLTAFPTPLAERVARNAGACALLHKPQPLAEVEARVCALLGGCANRQCDNICAPFAHALGDNEAARADLHSFLLLFRNVRREQADAVNAATLRELHRTLMRIAREAPPAMAVMLTRCLSGSPVLNEMLQATSHQPESAAAARQLAAAIARLTGES